MSEQEQEYFVITRLCREDIGHALKRCDLNFTDTEMKRIASKMAGDYLNQLYWGSLRIIAQNVLDERDDDTQTTGADAVTEHDYQWKKWCGAKVCTKCGDHKGLARCFCGWNVPQGESLELKEWG